VEVRLQDLGILRPDIVLVLDVGPKVARKLALQKGPRSYLGGRRKDIAEKDFNHQEEAYREYLRMARTDPAWVRVPCITEGRLDSDQVIYERIWEIVRTKL